MRSHPAGGAAFVERGELTRIRLHQLTATEKALAITGLVTLIVALALAVFTDPFVTTELVIVVWVTVPLTFLCAYLYFRPKGFLVLDGRQGRIKIPSGKQREKALKIPWAQVSKLKFVEVERVSAQGDYTGVAYTVVLTWLNDRNRERSRTLITWDSEFCAKRFFVWLYPRVMDSSWVRAKERRSV